MNVIKKDDVISIEYVISNPQGLILDSSQDGAIHFLFGHGEMFPQVESHLVGLKVDDMLEFELAKEENLYGEYDPQLVFQVGSDQFDEGEEISVGKIFQNDGGFFRVTAIENDLITLDGNHPLIGQDLHWRVVVVAIRPATEVELDLGRAHVKETSGAGESSCCSGGVCGSSN